MAGSLQLAGAQTQKPPRFVPLSTDRFSAGIISQRSPLRGAGSAYETRYLGPRQDALIDGSNCEITPKLTLARRPGNPVYNSNTFSAVTAFYSFREFGSNSEQIRVMADTANTLYDATAGGQISVFSKSTGSGQTFMQSVGNTLFFANGVDQKKWIQSLFTRTSGAGGSPNIGNSVTLNASQFPFISTYLIDSNGNLQELLATKQTTVTNVAYVSATNTLTLTVGSITGITLNEQLIIWDAATATWLNGITLQVTTAPSGNTVVCKLVNATHADYASAAETANLTLASGGTPVTGSVVPTWSTTVPSSGNLFQGGITIDGTAVWINRGNPVRNWGIVAGTSAPTVTVGTSTSAWKASTFFSLAGVIVDTQFGGQTNIWQVTVSGKSGNSNPLTSNPTSGTTTVTDGGVTWKCVASTHSGDSAWGASTTFAANHLIVANAAGVQSLFQLQTNNFPSYSGSVTANFYPHNEGSFAGQCELRNPIDGPNNPGVGFYTLQATATGNSVLFNPNQQGNSGQTTPLQWATLTTAGDISGYTTPYSGAKPGNYTLVVTGTLSVPVAGQYSFTIFHDDGMFWGIGASAGNQATRVSGPQNSPAPNPTVTALNGYNVMGANNPQSGGVFQDLYIVNFPVAGSYPFELDFAKGGASGQFLALYCNGQTPVPGTAQTGTIQPIWPGFSTSFAPNYASVSEVNNAGMGSLSGNHWNAAGNGPGPLKWSNLGPIADSVWTAGITYTLPNTTITDPNNNTEAPFRAGVAGTSTPTFATGINQLTKDNPNLIWINQGPASAPSPGTVSTFNGGWKYCVCLVNTATNTVSNASTLSATTGNFIGASGVTITGGIPATASIDPQSDFVAIFRTTDGLSTPFLIPGTSNSFYTIPLSEYLANGYLDSSTDSQLNNLLQAPIFGEQTPPALGAQNLTYHLSRIWFSVGNVVYWTSGPIAPIGNGVEGVLPTNNQTFPSLVRRIVPTTVGAFVFTVSDVYVIIGQGTSTNPIQPAYPYAPGLGLLSYNALDIFGSSIGFFATDKTFNVLDISSGPSEVGFNIGDKLQGSSWNPQNVYVTWHSSGEDKAWFLSDGATGWYRIGVTPSPEQGVTISPFATIVGGAKAVTSIETSPGTHQLLVGPTSSGPILARSLTNFQDNGTGYKVFAVVGSHVLASPGQLAEVAFITTDSVATGTPVSVSVILDEAVPYYTGSFEPINEYVEDPPTLPPSGSTYAQRFYLSLTQQPAVCRHLQYRVDFPADSVKNELMTATIFGALLTES